MLVTLPFLFEHGTLSASECGLKVLSRATHQIVRSFASSLSPKKLLSFYTVEEREIRAWSIKGP
jgi:hypothetical protein